MGPGGVRAQNSQNRADLRLIQLQSDILPSRSRGTRTTKPMVQVPVIIPRRCPLRLYPSKRATFPRLEDAHNLSRRISIYYQLSGLRLLLPLIRPFLSIPLAVVVIVAVASCICSARLSQLSGTGTGGPLLGKKDPVDPATDTRR